MKKTIVVILLTMTTLCGQAQERTSTLESIFAQQKPHAWQLQLSGASSCGGVVDCNKDSFGATDPCLWDKLACHLESFSRATETSQTWLFGGAKIKTELGPLTFSVGRHTDNVILTRAPFIESTYRTGFQSSVSVGVLQTPLGTGSQNLWYLVFKKTL